MLRTPSFRLLSHVDDLDVGEGRRLRAARAGPEAVAELEEPDAVTLGGVVRRDVGRRAAEDDSRAGEPTEGDAVARAW